MREASSDLSRTVAQLLRAYEADETKSAAERDEARRVGALPILYDVTVQYFIRPDGELIMVDAMESPQPLPVTDETQKTVVLHIASEQLPVLGDLLPRRPSEARTCDNCGGAGFRELNDAHGKPFKLPCYECASLGWR